MWEGQYGCQKNRLDPRNLDSDTKFEKNFIFNEKLWKYSDSYFSIIHFWIPLYFLIELEKNVLDPKLLRFDQFFFLQFSWAILQEYDRQPEFNKIKIVHLTNPNIPGFALF